MSYACWLSDEMEESNALVIEDAWSADEAASEACSKWNDGGTFAGDEIPDPIEVSVRDADGVLWYVEVGVSWDPTFVAGAPTPAAGASDPDPDTGASRRSGDA